MRNKKLLSGAAICAALLVMIVAWIMIAASRNDLTDEVPASSSNTLEEQNDGTGEEAQVQGAAYEIRVDAADRSREVSPTLYGLFFEDINYAGDGGLYGELVQNRSFEFSNPLFGWNRVLEDGAAGTVAVSDEHPLNGNNPHYLVITADSAGGTGVSNAGYSGIFLESGKTYDFTVYARAEDAAGRNQTLLVTLRDADDSVLGSCEITGLTDDWEYYACSISSGMTTAKAKLAVVATEEGSVALDMISLFPQHTWNNRQNGLRADLAEKLNELNPKFLRFPGGCIVEGGSIENQYRWKNTIGDVSERQVQPNQWANNYYQSFGLGFHEYFLLAKDLGAEALPVVYSGITSCNANPPMVPLSDMQEYIDHALDLIEYANGDPETNEWAAKRAENGHPEPFNLKYLAIGNEVWGANYYTRYKMIHDAIKAEYPDIQLIFSAGAFPNDMAYHEAYAWLSRNGNPADIVDEHMYQAPEWFMNNADRYDGFDRNGPKVFVGEYAAHTSGRRNNMEAALAEAAFMTGLERNSDVVVMASYAPLFGRQGFTQWQPNLIWFDQSRVYGTPSYYVQQMFSSHVGDYVLPTEVIRHEEAPEPEIGGSVLLGSWLTQVEYDDVKVTDADGNILYEEDFEEADDLGNWRSTRGTWTVEDGVLKQSSNSDDVRLYLQQGHDWTDYTLSLRAKKTGGNEGMLIGFAVEDFDNYYWWNIGGWNNTTTAVEKAVGGVKTIVSNSVDSGVTTGQWYDIRIEISGGTVKCYMNDELIHEWDESMDGPLFSVSTFDEETGDVIVKVVNVSEEDKQADIAIEGASAISSEATAVVLQSDSLTDENTLDEPQRVIPKESRVNGLGSEFTYTFPARSVTILRLGQ